MSTLSNEVNMYPISSDNMSINFKNIPMQTDNIVEKWIVILLETNTNERQRGNENLIREHCDITGDIQLFNCVDRCVDFLTDILNEKVCLILWTSIAKTLLPMIHDLSQLKFIYTLRNNENNDALPTMNNKWTKIKGSFVNIADIFYHFKQSIRKSEYDSISISTIFPSTDGNANELDSSFMYSQLLKDSLLKIQYDKTAKLEFVHYLRRENANNSEQLKSINLFDQKYSPQSSILWYSKATFIYEPLNQALRTQNTDIIVRMGFYIQDLHREIVRLYEEQQFREKMFVYRGQALSKNDFEKLQKNQYGLLSFNCFLSTSIEKDVSLLLAESSSLQENSVGILFQIEIDSSISSAPFADLKNISQFKSEAEILFSMHTIFRIGKIMNIEEEVWQVNLTLTNDNDEQLKQVTECIRQQIQHGSANKSLGYLLIRMGEYNDAKTMYNKMLVLTSDNDIRSRIYLYNMLGGIEHAKSAYTTALSYYQQILDIWPLSFEYDGLDLTDVYNNMALVHYSMRDYSAASELYEIVVDNREKSLSSDSLDLGSTYSNIAVINTSMGRHSIALEYFQKSLNILEHSLPPAHPDLAMIYSNIGMINNTIGERKAALQYFEKALEVQKKSLPPTHLSMVTTLNNLAMTNHLIGQYQTAMEYFQSALKILKETSSCKHSDLAVIHNNISQLYKTWGNYDTALEYCLKALNIQKTKLPLSDPKLAVFYINTAMLYRLMGNFPDAIEYLEKAHKIQQKFLPPTHPDFIRTYNSFGLIHQAKEEFWNALAYYQKALSIQETTFPPTHSDLASIYNNIDGVELRLGRAYIALDHIEKVLHILEAHLPPTHSEIGRTYLNMGTIHMEMKNYSETQNCFTKAFNIYKTSLPLKHPDFGKFYTNVGLLNFMMGKYSTASKHFEKAREILEEVLPPNHPDLVVFHKTISKTQQMMSLYPQSPWNIQFT